MTSVQTSDDAGSTIEPTSSCIAISYRFESTDFASVMIFFAADVISVPGVFILASGDFRHPLICSDFMNGIIKSVS